MSDEYGLSTEARARRRRTTLTLLIVALLVFFAIWYARSYVRADTGEEPTTQESAATTPPECSLRPADVTVNVFNSTDRTGLAAEVAERLRTRGFEVELIANAPSQLTVTGIAQVRHGKSAADEAALVARHVGEVKQVSDERGEKSVDLVLGENFENLRATDQIGC